MTVLIFTLCVGAIFGYFMGWLIWGKNEKKQNDRNTND